MGQNKQESTEELEYTHYSRLAEKCIFRRMEQHSNEEDQSMQRRTRVAREKKGGGGGVRIEIQLKLIFIYNAVHLQTSF